MRPKLPWRLASFGPVATPDFIFSERRIRWTDDVVGRGRGVKRLLRVLVESNHLGIGCFTR
jgi:hypothetical protein